MALTVETGAGVSGANSYISQSDANDYLKGSRVQSQIGAWTKVNKGDQELALIQATATVDMLCSFAGVPVSVTQALEWPRAEVPDGRGSYLASDAIPEKLRRAVVEQALADLETGKGRWEMAEARQVTSASNARGTKSRQPATSERRSVLHPKVRALVAPYCRTGDLRLVASR